MTRGSNAISTEERIINGANGWVMLVILLVAVGFGFLLVVTPGGPAKFVAGVVMLVVAGFCLKGLFTLEPNQAAVMIFFGSYAGTLRESGFFWVNPFYARTRVSLRINNWNTPVLKVNDERGSPIEIAAVVVWRVQDTAQAMFDVDDYGQSVLLVDGDVPAELMEKARLAAANCPEFAIKIVEN